MWAAENAVLRSWRRTSFQCCFILLPVAISRVQIFSVVSTDLIELYECAALALSQHLFAASCFVKRSFLWEYFLLLVGSCRRCTRKSETDLESLESSGPRLDRWVCTESSSLPVPTINHGPSTFLVANHMTTVFKGCVTSCLLSLFRPTILWTQGFPH